MPSVLASRFQEQFETCNTVPKLGHGYTVTRARVDDSVDLRSGWAMTRRFWRKAAESVVTCHSTPIKRVCEVAHALLLQVVSRRRHSGWRRASGYLNEKPRRDAARPRRTDNKSSDEHRDHKSHTTSAYCSKKHPVVIRITLLVCSTFQETSAALASGALARRAPASNLQIANPLGPSRKAPADTYLASCDLGMRLQLQT